MSAPPTPYPVPRYGSSGTKYPVTTNSFEITRLPTKSFFQYDAISPEIPPFMAAKRRDIIYKLQTQAQPGIFTPQGFYDGRAIFFSSHQLRLPNGSVGAFVVSLGKPTAQEGSPGVYKVTISISNGAPINPSVLGNLKLGHPMSPDKTAAVNVLQMVIRAAPNLRNPNNGKAYFTQVNSHILGRGFEIWQGFHQSVRYTIERMLINVDTTTAIMYESGRAIDVALKVLSYREPRPLEQLQEQDRDFRILEQHLKNLRITIIKEAARQNSNGKSSVKVIRGLVPAGGKYVFSKDDQEMTVEEYYRRTYNITIRYPKAPGIRTSGRNAPIQSVIPIELCEIVPGQFYKKKLPDELTAEVIKHSVLTPERRLGIIRNGYSDRSRNNIESPVQGYAGSPFIQDSGMTISTTPLVVPGRLLDTPRVMFGNGSKVMPDNGSWNLKSQTFVQPLPLNYWGIVSFEPLLKKEVIDDFAKELIDCCNKLGMRVKNPSYVGQGNSQAIQQGLTQAGKGVFHVTKNAPELLLLIMPLHSKQIKAEAKLWGDSITGVTTQCVREGKLHKGGRYSAGPQYCSNVAMKINVRLGGRNFTVDSPAMAGLVQNRCVIMGADVCHAGPGANRPSIASLVYSIDGHATKYTSLTTIQPPRQEMITDLEQLVSTAIVNVTKINQSPPGSIIFYRDGVSEGEYERVAQHEIAAIKRAFVNVREETRMMAPPKLTFIVVGKRHHVRFFPDRYNADKKGNAKAGLVVDKGLSNPIAQDFYLQSQGSLQGTSRPAHYIVLKDELFKEHVDALQELTFALCHVYAKATRSVSIPAPVYYADLACGRTFYFDPELDYSEDNFSVSSGQPAAPFDLERWKRGFRPIHVNLQRRMYFL